MRKSLRELPGVYVDAEPFAAGLLEMFNPAERLALRFGMLPAAKIECLQECLEKHFRESLGATGDGDVFEARVGPGDIREFRISKLVSEATREITLALYSIGDLIV